MRSINSRTGWRCAAGAAALWDTERQRAGAACCLLQLGVCTGFFASVKLNVWPGEEKSHIVREGVGVKGTGWWL